MNQEIFELVKDMNLKDIDTQLALQCAPLITGLKMANLLLIQNENVDKVISILINTDISYYILMQSKQKTTLLLYRQKRVEDYLINKKTEMLMEQMGYREIDLKKVLPMFQKRYHNYMTGGKNFPHELGLLLGYPVEDVVGFIENKGKNSVYNGYWKVYENENLLEKVNLFQKFEQAKMKLLQLVSNGGSIVDVINIDKLYQLHP